MIQFSSAGKRCGPKMLFENLDWLITPRERVGLVGANGTGKTTLLKALARLEPLDYGEITFAKGTTAGYLPQDGLTLSGRSVMTECMSVFGDLLSMEQEMESLMNKMAEIAPAGDGMTKQAFGHGAATYVAGANKQDCFHPRTFQSGL